MGDEFLTEASAQFTQGTIAAIEPFWFAALVALSLAMFAVLLVRLLLDHQSGNRARAEMRLAAREFTKFNVAIDSMAQGLVMFDAAEKVLLWNRSYLRVSGLTAEFMQREPNLADLLNARRALGTLAPAVVEHMQEFRERIGRGESTNYVFEDPSGRSCRIISVPMSGGGWVSTYEDITRQVGADRIIENQKTRLDAAISNMSQGLCMFDKEQRLIVCNKHYADIYGLAPELTVPGTPLRQILEWTGSAATAPEDRADFIDNRIERVTAGEPYEVVTRQHDGRYIAIVHRTTADGGWVSTHEDVTVAKHREELFRLLFDGSPLAMWVVDSKTLKFLAVNDVAISSHGYSREQFLEMTAPELRPFEDREAFTHYLRALPELGNVEGRVGRLRIRDGSIIDVEVYARPLVYGCRPAWLTVINNITTAKHAADELIRTKKFLDAVIENVPVPIMVRDVAGLNGDARGARFYLFNRAYEELTGSSRETLIGKTAAEIYTRERADLVVAADNEAMRTGRVVNIPEHAIDTVRNGTRLVTGKKTVIRDGDGKPEYVLTALDDVTERRQSERRIAYLAHNDSLTSLPNRATFVEYLDAALAEATASGEPFAVLCVDLDRFKEANDIYGHVAGDGLLRDAARRLNAAAKGQFLARVGGDEFTLIVRGGSQPQGAIALSERLLARFKPAFEIDGRQLQLGMSIGGAVYPADGDTATALIANADAALYQAKAEARGSLRMFNAKIGARLHERRALQFALQVAVSRNELFLHYQPQLRFADGEIDGFEALVRWQCPSRGLIAPGEFIPIAEESGLIVSVGEWILREACREAASWSRPLKIAVNISPIQFQTGDLAARVHLILLETGLAPNRLELEITEGVLIDDFQRAVSILRKIKALGVQIAMDDFGKGYSSLSYLHSFAFDKIKIDRSFIGDIETNHHSLAIVRAIVTLGHSLGVPVLAEGVETESQRRQLALEGCDYVQGYLTGRPSPVSAYAGVVGLDVTPERNIAGRI